MSQSRRDLRLAVAGLGGLAALPSSSDATIDASSNDSRLVRSRIFPFGTLPVLHAPNGGESRAVLRGTLATDEYVGVHETTRPPAQMPHSPHRHTHSEFLLIGDGRLEVSSGGQQGWSSLVA